MITETHPRALFTIVKEIRSDWKKPYFGAVPYMQAMDCMYDMNSKFGADSAKEIVLRFLSNASTWRGETARRIKAELKEMVK
jgi:hypothetical protein